MFFCCWHEQERWRKNEQNKDRGKTQWSLVRTDHRKSLSPLISLLYNKGFLLSFPTNLDLHTHRASNSMSFFSSFFPLSLPFPPLPPGTNSLVFQSWHSCSLLFAPTTLHPVGGRERFMEAKVISLLAVVLWACLWNTHTHTHKEKWWGDKHMQVTERAKK